MKDDNIQVLSPKFRVDEILDEIRICLEKGWTGMGFKTIEFEDAWSIYSSLNYSHFLSSNTVGLHLAIEILKRNGGWQDGDEIITTPLTFISTNHSILHSNLVPVFADVDESLCLDPSSVKSRITDKTRAILFVGIGGNTGRLNQIRDICQEKNIKLILDAAHMAGTYVNDNGKIRHAGKEADISIFSFQAVKNLPTADSGMICFKNKDDLVLARKLSWLGIDKDTYSRTTSSGTYKWKYEVPHVGYKYHGNSIMASIGLVQLKYLDQDNDYRNKIAQMYDKRLSTCEHITLISKSDYCSKSSRHLYQIRLMSPSKKSKLNRDNLISFLHKHSIFPGVHYIDNTNYKMYNYAKDDCPKSRKYSNELLSLPLHLNMDEKKVGRVCDTIFSFLERF